MNTGTAPRKKKLTKLGRGTSERHRLDLTTVCAFERATHVIRAHDIGKTNRLA